MPNPQLQVYAPLTNHLSLLNYLDEQQACCRHGLVHKSNYWNCMQLNRIYRKSDCKVSITVVNCFQVIIEFLPEIFDFVNLMSAQVLKPTHSMWNFYYFWLKQI